ncbi:MAG: sulfatase [Deltaproteobacteria bacterium]|nr:sulfatase [Deltaproteobacteria bacterium]
MTTSDPDHFGTGPRTYCQQGASAGLCAGVALGLVEALAVLWVSAPPRDLTVLPYAAVTYGVACALVGMLLGLGAALAGRLARREPAPAERVFAFVGASLFSGLGFVIARFRVFRDVYLENLPASSAKGLAVQAAILLLAVAVFLAGRIVARLLVDRTPARLLLRSWGSPLAFGTALALCAALGQLGAASDARAAPRGRRARPELPNVVLIVVDTLRADHVGAYGYRGGTTPRLDSFARDAVVFQNAFAQASWTRPSFASILTGRYPSSHRTIYKPDSLPDEVTTLAEALSSQGYSTAGFVTNFNVAPYFDFGQGFDEYHYLEPELVLWANDTQSRLSLYSIARLVSERFLSKRLEVDNYYRDAAFVTRELLGWLDRRPRGPFFLFAGYMDPHDPYFRHPYDGTAVARVATPKPPSSRASELRELYDGEIRYWDHSFGTLIAGLKRRGLYENTLIVVTSDHGEEFAEHGGFWHGTTLYDEQVRVPLVARFPGGDASGTTEAGWVRHVDVAPTVLRLAGTSAPEGMQGGDLFEQGRQPVFAEEDHEGNRLTSIRVPGTNGSDLKLIVANESNPRGLPATELFDVARDPGERTNLADRRDGDLATTRRAMADAARTAVTGAVRAQSNELDDAARERLRSLGYAGGEPR